MAARKSSVEEDTIDVNSLRSFTIPKKKKSKRELFESIALNSREFQHELLPIFEKHLKEKDGRRNFTFLSARLVHNDDLLNLYLERRKEMRRNGYTDKDVQDTFAFLYSENDHQIRQICEHGLKVGNVSTSVLGNPQMGVSLCRHPDISRPTPFVKHKDGYIIMFKFMKGKVKLMTENRGGEPLDPQPNYDCHISKLANAVDNSTPQQAAYDSTQYYLFEYGDFDLEERPRQIYPYAVLQFKFVGDVKVPGKLPLTKPVSLPKVTSIRQPTFPSPSLTSKNMPVSPHVRSSLVPGIEIKNDPRRKRVPSQAGSQEEPPATRFRPNDNDPRLKSRLHQRAISQSCQNSNANTNLGAFMPKKIANVGSVGTEVDAGGTIVWNGCLKSKHIRISPVDMVVFGDPVKPARLGCELNINMQISVNELEKHYFRDLDKLSKTNEIKHNNYYYCCAELRPSKDADEKFSHLINFLSKKSSAAVSPVDDQGLVFLLASCDLTRLLGKNPNKLITSSSLSVPSPSQSKPLPSPGCQISYTPSPSTPTPSPDSTGANRKAPLLNPDLVSQTFSGQSTQVNQQDIGSASVDSPQSTNSWSLPPSPSVFSSPSPAESQCLPAEQDVYNDGYQKFVPVDSLVYRKNLTRAFLNQTMVQDKRNIDVARRRSSTGSQRQQQGFRPVDGTAMDVLTNKQACYLNSNAKVPLSPLAMAGIGVQLPYQKMQMPHVVGIQGKVANTSPGNPSSYMNKNLSIIGPPGQVLEPISPAGSGSSSCCASPVPTSPYSITPDSNSLVDQLQQQLHRKMSPIKDMDVQLKVPPAKEDQFQQQLHQQMSPLQPLAYGESSSSIAVGQMMVSDVGGLTSSYLSQMSQMSESCTSLSNLLSPELHHAASLGTSRTLELKMRPPAANTAFANAVAVKMKPSGPAQTTSNITQTSHSLEPRPQQAMSFAIPMALDPRKIPDSATRAPYEPLPGTSHEPVPGLPQGLAGQLKPGHPLNSGNIPASDGIAVSLHPPLQHQQCSLRQPSLYPCNQPSQHLAVQEGEVLLSQRVSQTIVQRDLVQSKLPSNPCLTRLVATSQQSSLESSMTSDQSAVANHSTSGSSILQNILTMAKRDLNQPNAENAREPTDSLQQLSGLSIPSQDQHPNNESNLLTTSNPAIDTSQNLVQSLSVGATSLTARHTPVAGASVSHNNSRTTNTSAKLIPSPMLISSGNSGITNSMSNNNSTVKVSNSTGRPLLSTTCSSNSNNNSSLVAGSIKPCQTGRLITEKDSSAVISATWQGSQSDSTRVVVSMSLDSSEDESHLHRQCDSPSSGNPQEQSESDTSYDGSPTRLSLSDPDDLREDFNDIVRNPLPSARMSSVDDADINLSDDLINLIVRSQPLAAKKARELKEQIRHIEEQSEWISHKNRLVDESSCREHMDESESYNTAHLTTDSSHHEAHQESTSTSNTQKGATPNQLSEQSSSEVHHDNVKRQCSLQDPEHRKVCLKSPRVRSLSDEWPTYNSNGKSPGKQNLNHDLKVKVTCEDQMKKSSNSVPESPTVDPHFGTCPVALKVKEIPIDVLQEDSTQSNVAQTSAKYANELHYYSKLYEKSSNQQLLALGLDYVSVRFLGGARVHRLQENNELSVMKEIRKRDQIPVAHQMKPMAREDALQDSVNCVLHEMSSREDKDDDHERVLLCHVVLHYLLPLGQAPDEERREVLDDSGDSQSGCSNSGFQGSLGKTSSHVEHQQLHRRHVTSKQDEQEKQEIFHIYKKHRDLADVLKCLSSRNFHSRHTRPLCVMFSGPFSKCDPQQKYHHTRRTPLTDLDMMKGRRSRSVDELSSSSDVDHPLSSQPFSEKTDGTSTVLMITKDGQSRHHRSMFSYTKGKLETSRNKCLRSAVNARHSKQQQQKQHKSSATPVIPTHMPTIEIPTSPR